MNPADVWWLAGLLEELLVGLDHDRDGKIFVPVVVFVWPMLILGLWMIARTFGKRW